MDHYGHARFTAFPLPPASLVGPVLPYVPMAAWAPRCSSPRLPRFGRPRFGGRPVQWPSSCCSPGCCLRNRPEDVGLPPIEEYHGDSKPLTAEDEVIVETQEGSWQLIGAVLSTPRIWTLALAYFSVKLVRYAFIFWGPKYVAETIHSDALASTIVAAAMPIGGLVGVIATGYLSDKLFQARRAPVGVLSCLPAPRVMSVGLFHLHNPWIMAAFFFPRRCVSVRPGFDDFSHGVDGLRHEARRRHGDSDSSTASARSAASWADGSRAKLRLVPIGRPCLK